jgi:hypothetical protein
VKLSTSVILLLASAGCAGRDLPPETSWIPAPAADLGAIVARVGSVPIYAREVEAQAANSQGATLREALDTLISSNLLAEKAHRTWPLRPDWLDPELRSALAERLIERDILPQLQRDSVPDQELRFIYQKAITSFVHSRLVEVGLLVVFTGAAMAPETRAERAEVAKDLAAHVASMPITGPADFEAIAKDSAWKARGVTYRRTLQSLDEPFSRKVGTAVAKLKASGDMTPLVDDTDGFFLATYAGERPAENRSFAEVREDLRQRYYERWRAQRLEQMIRKLAESHRVESHPHLLSQATSGHRF